MQNSSGCVPAYLFIQILKLAIRKELEGCDGEAAGLSIRRKWLRMRWNSLWRCWVQRVGTSVE